MSSDRSTQYKDWILNVIDQLRSRKARPDLERICHFVERKHGLDRSVTETQIEKLVDMGIVIKVVYKRGTSYRNASKSRKRSYGSNVLNSNIASRKIIEAVISILRQRKKARGQNLDNSDKSANVEREADEIVDECFVTVVNDEEGVSAREIETWLSDDDCEPFMCPIHLVIQREVDAGRLIHLDNGNYLPVLKDQKTEVKSPPAPEPARPQLHKSVSVMARRGRPPKKKLTIARSFSCGDTNAVHASQTQVAPTPTVPTHLCDFCQLSARCNRRGLEEELLFCKDCNAKAHPSCMQYSPELAKRARNTAWQCIDCKTCCICYDPGEADCMLFCDACDKGYHMMCHEPEVDEKPQGKWICSECVGDGVDIDEIEENNNNVVDSTVRSTDTESLSSFNREKDSYQYNKSHRESCSPSLAKVPKMEEEVYPNASDWTIEDVENFFKQKGFADQATCFKEQEIDGQSLLLLKRSDVLQGLSLKLGPALKMYNHVMRLQTAGQPIT